MPRRKRVERETVDYLSMLRRMIAAAGRRVADADEVELGTLLGMRHDLDKAIAEAVNGQRRRGVSWAYIASAMGTTRQAAQQRFGSLVSTNPENRSQ